MDSAENSALEKTVALLEATLEATHDAVLVVDLEGQVILSGGFVFVESEIGRGATIRLYFPPASE